MMNGENDAVTLLKRHNDRSRLPTRPLFGHHKFAALEILPRFRQQNRELEREHMFAVQILMEAVVIVSLVLEQKRCRWSWPAFTETGAPR